MQISAREIILDQLQQVHLAIPDKSTLIPDSHSSLNSLIHLDTLLRELLPTSTLDHIARSLVETTRHTLEMDLCVLMLTEIEDGLLTIQAASPDLNGRLLATPLLSVEVALWEKLCASSGKLPELSAGEREQLNPLKNVQYESLFIAPLSVGKECVGLLYCYSSKARDLDTYEQLLLQTIGSLAAMSIVNRRLIDAAASPVSVKSFFADLLAGDAALEDSLRGRAAVLGCDCTRPYIMLMLEIARVVDKNEPSESKVNQQATCRHAIKLVGKRMQTHYPGSLFDEREHRLYAMVALAGNATIEDFKMWLDALLQQVESELQVSLLAGISTACHDVRDYYGGFGESQEALVVAGCLNTRAACMHFAELGAYRYISPFARDHARNDLYLEQVAIIARYDLAHKRAELLDTLEVYLERWGNIKEVSEKLGLHRNTITQRLERIQSLCAIDLEHYSNWLPLQVAIMIHKLRSRGTF
jgi:sugar diacid utilization regulator